MLLLHASRNVCLQQRRITAFRSPLKISQLTQRISSRQSLSRATLRFKSTEQIPDQAAKHAARKAAYPERLLIYHAGTGRTMFVGCMKVTTIFIFAFFATIVAPSQWQNPAEPPWATGAVLACGLIPFLFTHRTTAPFVAYIHLRLPLYARQSRDSLLRYSRSLPPSAVMDITTINTIGKPRISKVTVKELHPLKKMLGTANYVRDTEKSNKMRPWWVGRAVREFAIGPKGVGSREVGVWENVAKSIEKNSRAEQGGT